MITQLMLRFPVYTFLTEAVEHNCKFDMQPVIGLESKFQPAFVDWKSVIMLEEA